MPLSLFKNVLNNYVILHLINNNINLYKMKKNKNQITMKLKDKFNKGINSIPVLALSLFLLFAGCFTTTSHAQIAVGVNITPPYWAPAYDDVQHVQYYYLPDIEVYYDVWNNEYVYLEDGNWMFAAQLPPSYAWYDFNNAFVVVLDRNVHQPWMHYHYYVAHYPRYYYRTTYSTTYNDANHPVRGFNENAKGVVYRGGDDRHVPDQRREPVSREKVVPTRAPQKMQYYGKPIGEPVKVEKQMRRPADDKGGRK